MCKKECRKRTELVFSIIFGIWNNASTVYNAKTLYEDDLEVFAYLSIFFLVFPGLVTSVGFLILHILGHRKIGKLPSGKFFLYFIALLLCYPLVPIYLGLKSLITGRKFYLATIAKLFEGFLDDGPQFVIKLIVFVLYNSGTDDHIFPFVFKMSMVTSFLSLVFFGMRFNEGRTFLLIKIFVSAPMIAALALTRTFVIAVFIKETLENPKEVIAGGVVILVFCFVNIGSYAYCGQDLIRSIVFGLSSFIIPAGYGNDAYFYQRPRQALLETQGQVGMCVAGEGGKDNSSPLRKMKDRINEQGDSDGGGETSVKSRFLKMLKRKDSDENNESLPKMRSGLFLIQYAILNAVMLSSCAIYISVTRDLSSTLGDALKLPLILALVPGTFLTLARAFFEKDLVCCRPAIWKPIKLILAVIFILLAYISIIPAILGSVTYKLVNVVQQEDEFDDFD